MKEESEVHIKPDEKIICEDVEEEKEGTNIEVETKKKKKDETDGVVEFKLEKLIPLKS